MTDLENMDQTPEPELKPEGEVEEKEKESSLVLARLRKVLLAGIGVVSLAQEEVEDLVNKLIDRGEIAEKDGRKLVDEVLDKRKKTAEKMKSKFDKRLDDLLERLNVPTRADIDALNAKITELTAKIDRLKNE